MNNTESKVKKIYKAFTQTWISRRTYKKTDIETFFTYIYTKLNGYAILYWDAKVEEAYGLTNPDLMRFP